jgi:hypothetical protein
MDGDTLNKPSYKTACDFTMPGRPETKHKLAGNHTAIISRLTTHWFDTALNTSR